MCSGGRVALVRRSKPIPQNEFFPGFAEIVEIGVGSLATVYRAREIGTNRHVALKLLNVRDASPRALESFERESIALGAVSSHPNIVTLYRSFRVADERPVLVLELCNGSIGDRMRGGAGLPVAEVVTLGIKIAGALETAHRAGILHRDVKPQNILMTEFGEPALADFGVAMLQSSTQTTAGLFDFTTLHAAPELLEGGETSAATDVYELASSLYQLIAGRAAFRAYDGESPAAVILRILRDPVQALANTQAPSSLSDLLIHAMSKDKASRPPTAAEFAAELAAVEVECQWPRTQFLIREAGGGSTGLPTITRLPEVGRRRVPPEPPAAGWSPPALPAEPADEGWSTPTVVLPPVAAAGARPVHERVVVERQVIERLVFEPRPLLDDTAIVRADPDEVAPPHLPPVEPDAAAASAPEMAAPETWAPPPLPPVEVDATPPELTSIWGEVAQPDEAQYPIPPSGLGANPAPAELGTETVPTWAFRAAAAPTPPGPASYGDLALDPMSLRNKVTLRAGTSSLVVDDSGLSVRAFLRRRSVIPWSDVAGFELQVDEVGRDGRLVVLTRNGPVELAATRRPAGEVRYLHALLDAYRQRAVILGRH